MKMQQRVKTATVTWINYYNFGTYLQAFALQQIIKELGFSNVIISDKRIINKIVKKKKDNILWLRQVVCYVYKAITCNVEYAHGIDKSKSSYDLFAHQYLTIDKDWESTDELNQRYDVFICGSDQIWYPSSDIFNPYYYLSFTNKKKIAYAPSIGTDNYPGEFKSKVKPLIESFSSISVREEKSINLLHGFISKEITAVLDPTLLLNSEQWKNMVHFNYDSDAYVLCYLLTYNRAYIDYVRKYAIDKKMKLKIFITDERYLSYADVPLFVGPREFLEEICNADCFFTDSFHGTIFAIQFQIEFVTFRRFKQTDKRNQNSRLENLFSLLDIKARFVGEEELCNIAMLSSINYNHIHDLLDSQRKKSISFLSNALNK